MMFFEATDHKYHLCNLRTWFSYVPSNTTNKKHIRINEKILRETWCLWGTKSSVSLAYVRAIHRWPVNSPHKGPVTRKMFSFDGVIMYRIILLIFVVDNRHSLNPFVTGFLIRIGTMPGGPPANRNSCNRISIRQPRITLDDCWAPHCNLRRASWNSWRS